MSEYYFRVIYLSHFNQRHILPDLQKCQIYGKTYQWYSLQHSDYVLTCSVENDSYDNAYTNHIVKCLWLSLSPIIYRI